MTVFNELHPMKFRLSIPITLSGIVILFRLLQPLKSGNHPVNPEGSVIDSNCVQLPKEPTSVTLSGITNDFNELQPYIFPN